MFDQLLIASCLGDFPIYHDNNNVNHREPMNAMCNQNTRLQLYSEH